MNLESQSDSGLDLVNNKAFTSGQQQINSHIKLHDADQSAMPVIGQRKNSFVQDGSLSRALKSQQEAKPRNDLLVVKNESVFTLNLPYSQALHPTNLDPSTRVVRPEMMQRKNVHSFFRPGCADFCREEFKRNLKDKLKYTHSQQDKDPVKIESIPYKELQGTLDDTHIRLNQWKAKLLK